MSNVASAPGVETDARVESLVDTQLVYAHSIAALVTVLVSVIFGIIISLQFFPARRRGFMAVHGVGATALFAYTGHHDRLAGQRLPGLPLPCRAGAGGPAGDQRQTGALAVRPVEFHRGDSWLAAGAGGDQPAH